MEIKNLIREHEDFIKSRARSIARDTSEADELIQKANIILWQQCVRLSAMKPAEVRSFIARSVKNALIDIRRREKLTAPLAIDIPHPVRFESKLIDSITIQSVSDCLTEAEREIIHKTYQMGMDSAEIAKELNIPPATVRSKKARALKKLKKALEEKK